MVRQAQTQDQSRDVQHQAELAAYAIEHGIRATPEVAAAFAGLDEKRFNRVRVGQAAPDFGATVPASVKRLIWCGTTDTSLSQNGGLKSKQGNESLLRR